MKWEDALDTFAVRDFTNGERLVETTSALGDDESGKYLNTLFFTFANEAVNFYGVTYVEFGGVFFELFGFDFGNEVAHGFWLLRFRKVDVKMSAVGGT